MLVSATPGGADGQSSVASPRSDQQSVASTLTGTAGGATRRASTRGRRSGDTGYISVVIRVRPPLPRELNNDRPFTNAVAVNEDEGVITIAENLSAVLDAADDLSTKDGGGSSSSAYASHRFTFDNVYDQTSTQEAVYAGTAKATVESSLQGYNATIFAYGQTGTGKTYTMEGFSRNPNASTSERGIIPRAIEQIFSHIAEHASARMRFLVRASYLQIYNEAISDLLKSERANLAIREDKRRGVFVEGLSEWVVRSPAEIYGLMERGGSVRATGATKMNEISSRSHAVFIIIVEQSQTVYVDDKGESVTPDGLAALMRNRGMQMAEMRAKLEQHVRQSFRVGKLNLVDLAGSERVRLSGATGQRLEESKKINQSLSALGNVIAALTDAKTRTHVPYRDSKLTRILEDSLGGNCKTTMMAMISPALEALVESLSTLKFANRAKNIKNEPKVNEDIDQKSLLRKYERELKRLRAELEERSRNVVDQRKVLELEEERRRAEEDKMAAIRALEARSVEFMREKEEKRRLEERIQSLTSQMIRGAGAPAASGDGPAADAARKEQSDRLLAEYEGRMADLERERESIEEEKAQVDRYKQLLLKQRDIMIALTQRLNERDEQIMALQDELDAYDSHQRRLEEKLDEKTAQLIHLQRVTLEHNAASPVKNNDLMHALGDWGGGNGGSKAKLAAAAAAAAAAQGAPFAAAAAAAAAAAGGGGDRRSPSEGAAAAAALHLDPALLVTHRQYLPFGQEYPGGESGGGGGGGGDLLSARDKIAELTRLCEARGAENERMAKEVEDVQADKVSVEYQLREKLERLVKSEIEGRLKSVSGLEAAAASSSSGSGSDDATSHKIAALQSQLGQPPPPPTPQQQAAPHAEVARLQADNRRLEARLAVANRAPAAAAAASAAAPDAAAAASLRAAHSALEASSRSETALMDRCKVLATERRAVSTIMESKIAVLVSSVARASDTLLGRGAAGADDPAAAAAALTKDVGALQRLVAASIAALRNAEAADAAKQSGRGGGA